MTKKDKCSRMDIECPHKLTARENTCFIIMAYDQTYSTKIEKILNNAVRKVFKFTPILAKNIKHQSSMDLFCTKVCRPIKQATECIVDLTYNSTNIGLECAIAQSFKKQIIITVYKPPIRRQLTRDEKKSVDKLKKEGLVQYLVMPYNPPADLASLFRIEYKNEKELIKKLKEGFNIKKIKKG